MEGKPFEYEGPYRPDPSLSSYENAQLQLKWDIRCMKRREQRRLEQQAASAIDSRSQSKASEELPQAPAPSRPARSCGVAAFPVAATPTASNTPAAATPVAATSSTEVCPSSALLPLSSDEEMDVTSTCKRAREPSEDDDAAAPRKQAASTVPAPAPAEAVPATSATVNVPASAADMISTPPQPPMPPPSVAAAAQHRVAAPVTTRKARKQRKRRNAKRPRKQQPRVPKQATEEPSTPPPSPSLVESDFQLVVSKAARRRARALEAAVLPSDPAVVGTVLFRPSTPGSSFRGSSRLAIAAALSARPGVAAVRINHRRNIVAADASSAECLSALLSIKELNGVLVAAGKPADRRTCTGFVYGVDGDLTDAELLTAVTASVPVLSAARKERAVKLRFAGTVPPETVTFCKMPFRVRPVRPRPLQCLQCGRFGHVLATCPRPEDCIRCARKHPASMDCAPRCVNCGGGHSANTPTCPRWQEERRVATIIATSPSPVSRRAVKAAVREENHLRSYAAALKNGPPTKPPKEGARPTPAPRRSLTTPASSASPASPAVLPVAAPPAMPSAHARTVRAPNSSMPASLNSSAVPASPALPAPLATTPTPTKEARDALIQLLSDLGRQVAELFPADNPQRVAILQIASVLRSTVLSM